MARSIKSAIDNKQQGFVVLNSVFLPFHFELISAWIGKEMSLLAKPDMQVDFCQERGSVGVREGETYTNLVFRDHKDLKKEFGHYKGHIVLTVTEKGADIFNPENRHFLQLGFHDDTNTVFIELIDDPFEL
jgi:hypothetical protein